MKTDKPAAPPAPDKVGIGRFAPWLQWSLLLAVSIVLASFFEFIGLPAGLLMGPMLAAVLVGMNGGTIRLPRQLFFCVQFILAMMIAGAMTPGMLATFSGNWPLFLAVILSVIAVSTLCGWVITRMRILPGTTAIWGSSAGAASTMLLMADAYGADARLVAFMQYLRVIFVASTATVVAHMWVTGAEAEQTTHWFAPIDGLLFLETIAVGLGAALAGRFLRVPAGAFLLPFLLGAVLNVSGVMTTALPQWLLA
ncbi:MAG: AbrB family transcriptional regulator, partial [Ensifer adhaerens]